MEQRPAPNVTAEVRGLGTGSTRGRVGYAGRAFAPAPCSYTGIDAVRLSYSTVQDSGARPAMAFLSPLIAGALYEIGFAREFGPLTTWSN